MMHYGYIPSIIDHIDGNPLNNNIKNLRPATEMQNHHNMGISKRNKSGIKGVCWDKSKNKWFARCNFDYKSHHPSHIRSLPLPSRLKLSLRISKTLFCIIN
jgi:hypothetical protein